jgi:hypothetical protein
VQPPTECPATKCDVQDQPSINPCVVYKTAVDSCIRECGGGEECELSCKCNLKGSNPLCAECGSVDCGIDANDTADQARFKADQSTTHQDTRTTEVARAVLPPPMNPSCGFCLNSIEKCQKSCLNPGTCDDACNCYAQLHNRDCKRCKLPACNCGHTCPRLEPFQRRLAASKAHQSTTYEDTPSTEVARAVIRTPPINPCVLCQSSINLCMKKCANPGACDDTCNCYAQRHNRNCKGCTLPSCNCGQTCPRLGLLQQQLAIGAVSHFSDDSDALSIRQENSLKIGSELLPPPSTEEVQSGIVVPVSPGNTCLKALNKCKAACANPGACDDTCNCYYRGARDCKDVKIPECKCGHTCPTPPWH